ncbi:MAG TPA: hypothetical protein VMB49_19835 [Acidobacteriaceae bacterium]|nr:hypothetical protein [Acidobacteriaceae bacterium]
MTRLLRSAAFSRPLVVLPALALGLCGYSRGQMQVMIAQGDCSGNTPCTASAPKALDMESGAGQVTIVSSAGMAIPEQAAAIKNAPYQAQAVTEMKQTLADGSHINQTTTATVARDSEGRTVRIQKLNALGPWKSANTSAQNSQTLTTIFDPVAKEHIDYSSNSTVAHVISMPPLPPGTGLRAEGRMLQSEDQITAPAAPGEAGFVVAAGAPPAGAVAQGFAIQTRAISPDMGKVYAPKTESLGTKNIEGLQVRGTRTTTTIPAGTIGNDKDLNITRETWYSPDLQLVVQSTQNDPRFGETTYTLKNIQQGSPDVTLFQVPPNYTIDKVVPRVFQAPAQ